MPVRNSDTVGATRQLENDPELAVTMLRLMDLAKNGSLEEIVQAEAQTMEFLGHENHLIRDCAVFVLRRIGKARPDWAKSVLREPLQSANPLIRAEALHIIGYLPRPIAAPFLPIVLLLICDSSSEVSDRAGQALRRGIADESLVNGISEVAMRALANVAGNACHKPNATFELINEALRLVIAGRAAETPIGDDILRTAVADLIRSL